MTTIKGRYLQMRVPDPDQIPAENEIARRAWASPGGPELILRVFEDIHEACGTFSEERGRVAA